MDNSRYHKLRRMLPTEARLALLSLRKKAIANPIMEHPDIAQLAIVLQNYRVCVGNLSVVFSIESHKDGLVWHLSVSHPERYPSWDELMIIRSFMFDDDMEVVMIMPSVKEYINIHDNCFHMWHDTKSSLIKE